MLGMAVGLAASAAMTPIERRQCSTQRDGCCLKQGHCETCYFGEEPYDCNCECLERGLCPCTGWYGKTGECFSWYSPDGHKAHAFMLTTTGGPPPASTTGTTPGPATRENDAVMRGAALPDRRRFTRPPLPANYTTTIGLLGHRRDDGPRIAASPHPTSRNQPQWLELPSHPASSRLNQPLHRATARLATEPTRHRTVDRKDELRQGWCLFTTVPASRKTASKPSRVEFSYTSGLFKDGAAYEPAGTCTTAIMLVQTLTNAAQLARTLPTRCSPVLKTSAAAAVPAVQR
ncbi:hypothetical protein MY10362_001665 [Beauveria mimosiformis]